MSIAPMGIELDTGVPARRAFVVVGMHRSGTSAMTRVLSLLGAALPRELLRPAGDNETGFWEPEKVADLNEEILQALDSEWDDVFAFRPREYLANFDRFYVGRAVELLEKEFNGSEVIVLKDPRISVLTTFWERALRQAGYTTHYVLMVRNPLEVAESLRARNEFPREKSLLLWSSYMIAADRDTRSGSRTFVAYEQLMDDWRTVRHRLEESAGVPFPRNTATAAIEIDRFLDHRLRHHKATPTDLFGRADVPDEVKTLYRIFSDACEGDDVDSAALEAIEAELEKMDLLVGPLLADLRGRVRSLSTNIAELSESQAEANGRADSLGRELEAKAQELEAKARELDAKGCEAADLGARLADVEVARDRLAGEVEEQRRQLAESESLKKLLEQARSEKARTDEALAKALEQAAVRADELEVNRAEVAEALQALARKEHEHSAFVRQSLADTKAMKARLDGRFQEIATLTGLLAEMQAEGRRVGAENDWLRQIGTVLSGGSGGWKQRIFNLLPAAAQLHRQRKLLKRKGLFDGEAYLAANPDVAADGVDPLLHFLMHGLSEDRPRG